MDSNQYKDFLLSAIPTAELASGGTVVNCRCFYCPDSSDPKSKHFYISIPKSSSDPSFYYCHKCHSSGIVTYKQLLEWGIYNVEIAKQLTSQNKNIKIRSDRRIVYPIYNRYIKEDKISEYKLQYINQRLGTSFEYEDLKQLKIVLNLKDLLKYNHLYAERNQEIMNQLNINFLGFLSIDNSSVNLRRLCDAGNIHPSIDHRYFNYRLKKENFGKNFYTIPMKLNLNQSERIKIHIAEGSFDILSIYENIRQHEPGIYSSIGGSNYFGLILYFLKTFRLPYTEFHFYPDNDGPGSDKVMKSMIPKLKPFGSPVYIHRNIYPNQKDFGVSPDKIKESIQQLL